MRNAKPFCAPKHHLCKREESFGPVLAIKTYGSLDQAIEYVNGHPRPLALYYCGTDNAKPTTPNRTRCCAGPSRAARPSGKSSLRRGRTVRHRRLSWRIRFPDLLAPQRRFSAKPPERFRYPPFGRLTDLMLKVLNRG